MHYPSKRRQILGKSINTRIHNEMNKSILYKSTNIHCIGIKDTTIINVYTNK